MKCIILAAGYATRLYPLTENYPKALLKVNDKTILDYLIDDLNAKNYIDEYIIVTNHKYYEIFKNWCSNKKITILDDKSTSNDNRLGAVRDIKFAIDSLNIYDNILVIASDNILTFSLNSFIEYASLKNKTSIMYHELNDINKLRKTGVLELSKDNLVLSMEEKPTNPKTNLACPPFYYFVKEDITLIDKAIKSNINLDSPGSLIAYLCNITDIYAYKMPGERYDIGTIESYEYVRKLFKK